MIDRLIKLDKGGQLQTSNSCLKNPFLLYQYYYLQKLKRKVKPKTNIKNF